MKHLFLILLFTLPSLSLANNTEIYQMSVEITDLIYDLNEDLDPIQAQQIKTHLIEIKSTLTDFSPELCSSRNEVYKTAFQWGKNISGLNLTKSDAMNFAQNVSTQACPLIYLSTYKDSFTWAKDIRGLNLTKQKSMEFSTDVSDHQALNPLGESALVCIKLEYEFASSIGGLNLPKSEAKAFALKQCGL